MKTIDNDIKQGQFKHAYLLYGSEHYLIYQYKKKLLRAMVEEGDTMNFSAYEGKDINVNEVIDMAETLPFLAERRVILIENSGFFKKSCDELAEYLSNIPPSTYFIFVEEEVDSRLKMTKSLNKVGYATSIDTVDDNTLMRWIVGRVTKEGKRITDSAYRRFVEKTGKDMENIDKELEKLLSYCMDMSEIDVKQVEEIVIEQIQNKIFEMVDMIATHRKKEALDLYYNLLELNEAPMRILFQISKHFQTLMVVKVMSGQGYANRDIAVKANCKDWAVKKYQAQARAFSLERLKKAVKDGVEYETDVKRGQLTDRMAVEMFIVSYS